MCADWDTSHDRCWESAAQLLVNGTFVCFTLQEPKLELKRSTSSRYAVEPSLSGWWPDQTSPLCTLEIRSISLGVSIRAINAFPSPPHATPLPHIVDTSDSSTTSTPEGRWPEIFLAYSPFNLWPQQPPTSCPQLLILATKSRLSSLCHFFQLLVSPSAVCSYSIVAASFIWLISGCPVSTTHRSLIAYSQPFTLTVTGMNLN